MEFDWDEGNVEHITRHGVEPQEAEEAATDPHRAPFPAGGGRLGMIGKSEAGRILVVILERQRKQWKVITARDATPTEKRAYRRHNR